jgi:hypothetical protein
MATKFSRKLDELQRELAKATAGGEPMAKALTSEPARPAGPVLDSGAFMSKALTSLGKRHISSSQFTACEYAINAGRQPDPKVVKAVISDEPYSPWG